MYFYDTSSLLSQLNHAFETDEKFLISNLTFKELENIKTSFNKDEAIKYKARKLLHLLTEYESQYIVIFYESEWDKELVNILLDNTDSRIILCALYAKSYYKNIVFVTEDLSCYSIAKMLGLEVKSLINTYEEEYVGYEELICDDIELSKIYSSLKTYGNDFLLNNEYLILRDENDEVVDKLKYTTENGLEEIPYPAFQSKLFGKIKPKDVYQYLAMDSLRTNQVTMLRGTAGTGKSYLAMGFLFDKLERGEIDRIIIFCNTIATVGSAKLGYYPGSRNEKLLDSQIGNFLISKIGDKNLVEDYIAQGKIVLLPMSDIRGYDTMGMKAGIYITEAQNLDIELMRLALQRIGEDCICILDGDDDSQVDMPIYAGYNNGMKRVSEIFKGDKIFGEVTLKVIHRSHIAELANLL